MDDSNVKIISKDFAGNILKSWTVAFREQSSSRLMFAGKFETDVLHPELGLIKRGTVSLEYFWLDRWYNIFRFHEPSGEFRNYYCNVCMPPIFEDDVLEYVDLDLDLLVLPDFSCRVLDRDEYNVHAQLFKYPPEVCINAEKALTELIQLAESRNLPADPIY